MSDIRQRISDSLSIASPIRLQEMDAVSLLNRIDRKYILHTHRLTDIIHLVKDDYYVLNIEQERVFSYNTVYFDTPDYQFYKDHHNGLLNRVKVRCRQYVESGDVFFEVKRKYRGYRTDKFRKRIDRVLDNLGEEEYNEVTSLYQKHTVNQLDVALHNFFHRVTLVSKSLTERATIDFGLRFEKNDRTVAVNNIAVIEVKQGKYDERSHIVQALKSAGVREQSISKYTYGLLQVAEQVKYNAFKPLMNKINKLQSDGRY